MAATILVVEDNPVTCRLARATLEHAGFLVTEATTGHAALRRMEVEPPDLVLQDLALPDVDGFDLIGALRRLPGGAEVPILAFSGLLSKPDETRIALAGFDDFVPKPIEATRLVQIVRAHLQPPSTATERFGQGRRLLLVDDDPVQLKLTRLHLAPLGFEVATAADGEAALACARAAPPDVIVSDALMPRLDGFGLCLAVRRDPALATIPLVLVTSSYVEEADQALARHAGVDAFVVRTPDHREVTQALRVVLTRVGTRRLPPASPGPEVEPERVGRVLQQLDRQVALNVGLAQRGAMLTAELSVLSAISLALVRSRDAAEVLGEILVNCLDAAGTSRGAIYFARPGAALAVEARHGFPVAAPLADFFGHPELLRQALAADEPLALPSPAADTAAAQDVLARSGEASALLLPLVSGSERLGVLLLLGRPRNVTDDDWLRFAHAIAAQIGVAVALAGAFARVAASEQRYHALVESAQDAIVVGDGQGVLHEVNRAGERLLGLPRAALVGRRFAEFVTPTERATAEAYFHRDVTPGSARRTDVHIQRPDGTRAPIEVTSSRVEVHGQDLVIAVMRDMTERNALAEQLRQSQKMEAVGQLAGGVAHDFNNLLTSILCCSQFLLEALAPDSPLHEDAREIHGAGTRAAALTHQLLAFSRRQALEPRIVDLNAVVADTDRMLRRLIGEDIRLVTAPGDDLGRVRVDAGQVEQVILNLVVNARDAMPKGGRLTVATANAEIDAIHARTLGLPLVAGTAAPFDFVMLSVRDTGEGMTSEVRQRIFEPFFTTKSPGKGTGLGLATVFGIVAQSGGHIALESEPGRGSTFRVYLPRVRGELAPPSAHPARRTARGKETVLVVEDELGVRRLIRTILVREGYTVLEATDAEEALALWTGGTHEIHMLLTDVVLPGMNGVELATRLHSERAGLRVLLMSGYADHPRMHEMAPYIFGGLVRKPFTPDALAERVRTMLDASQPV